MEGGSVFPKNFFSFNRGDYPPYSDILTYREGGYLGGGVYPHAIGGYNGGELSTIYTPPPVSY